jgi:CheY-like chemotaxis protein
MSVKNRPPLHILLADDDKDDRWFFAKALDDLPFPTALKTVENGELLITHLLETVDKLPDVLFLDLNMPKKNGAECLFAIRANESLRNIPVIIYSTSLHNDIADILYKNGAYYFIRKTEFQELKKILMKVLPAISEKKMRPERGKFEFTLVEM